MSIVELPGGGESAAGPRGSVSSLFEQGSEKTHVIFAALAVTDRCIIMDLKRPKKDKEQMQYLCVSYDDPLAKAVSLSYNHDAEGCHLSILLPNAKQFLKRTSGKEVKMPDDATVRVDMLTSRAPDICLHVQGKLDPAANS